MSRRPRFGWKIFSIIFDLYSIDRRTDRYEEKKLSSIIFYLFSSTIKKYRLTRFLLPQNLPLSRQNDFSPGIWRLPAAAAPHFYTKEGDLACVYRMCHFLFSSISYPCSTIAALLFPKTSVVKSHGNIYKFPYRAFFLIIFCPIN